ncbi:MAG: hypothetical protein ACFB20_05970 [Opitutales bacterium]
MLANNVATTETALRHHLSLCDEVYRLLQTENTLLRRDRKLPDSRLLERKEKLLGVLEDSLRQLRSLNALGNKARSPEEREALRLVQRKLMKIFHLDRENERQLLLCSLPTASRSASAGVPRSTVRHAYAGGR